MKAKVVLTRNIPARDTSDEFVRGTDVDKKSPVKKAGFIPPLKGGINKPPVLPGRSAERKMGVDDLLAAADLLEPAERKQLLDRLSLARSAAPDAALRDVEMWSVAVYEALGAANGSGSGAAQGPMIIKRSVAAPGAWAPVAEFMDTSGFKDLKVAERQAAYRFLAQLLVDHVVSIARAKGLPVGAKLVSSCAGQISEVFERAFPGYIASGLAKVVVRQMMRPAAED